MLVRARKIARHSREGFSLVEILVVVAIIMILASVAGVYLFQYLDDAKVDRAYLDMQALETAANTYHTKNPGVPLENIEQLIPWLNNGSQSLNDPWGNRYQFDYMENEFGSPKIVFFTVVQEKNMTITWPRNAAGSPGI